MIFCHFSIIWIYFFIIVIIKKYFDKWKNNKDKSKEKKEQELNLLRDKYSNEVENKNSIIEGYKNEIDKFKLTNDENLK